MKKFIIYLFMIVLIFQSACLEDSFTPNEPPLDDTDCNKLLAYVNAQGYFRKLIGEPNLVTPDIVASNLDNYHIVDLRSHEEFINGRISGAVNVYKDSLITYLENLNNVDTKTILFVCKDGQLSSYVQCLVGLYGFNNIATLKYGMASWNIDFASEWMNNIRTISKTNVECPFDNHLIYFEERYTLPAVVLPPGENITVKVNESIKQLLAAPANISSDIMDEQTVFCHFRSIYQHFDYQTEVFENMDFICYGTKALYAIYPSKYPELPSHPKNTWWMEIPLQYDYRLSNSVHFLANDKPIVFYSTDGHDSAFAVALLRLLGYNAKSVLYGINSFQYNAMISEWNFGSLVFNPMDEIKEDAFIPGKYGNYPYISGIPD
jgi:rhodanese-related sulfurtransferase